MVHVRTNATTTITTGYYYAALIDAPTHEASLALQWLYIELCCLGLVAFCMIASTRRLRRILGTRLTLDAAFLDAVVDYTLGHCLTVDSLPLPLLTLARIIHSEDRMDQAARHADYADILALCTVFVEAIGNQDERMRLVVVAVCTPG